MKVFLILCIFFISCQIRPVSQQIVVPEIDENFYEKSVLTLEEALEKEPVDIRYLKLLLRYYEILDWPPQSARAFDIVKKTAYQDDEILYYKIAYFSKINKHEALIAILNNESYRSNFPEKWRKIKINSLLALDRTEAIPLDIDLLIKSFPSSTNYRFAAKTYHSIGNNILALYYAEKAKDELNTAPEFKVFYASLLNQYEFYQKAEDLFTGMETDQLSREEKIVLANAKYGKGEVQEAAGILLMSGEKEDRLRAAGWYTEHLIFDKAYQVLYNLTLEFPSDIVTYLAFANLEVTRGFYHRAIRNYEIVLEIDSTNQIATDQVNLLNRKIAYLQKIRALEERSVLPELTTKKAIIE